MRVVALLGDIDHWDLGYDAFHERWVPWERFGSAVDALRDAGASFSVRVCERSPASDADLLARLRQRCGPGARILLQPVKRLGRAAEMDLAGAGGEAGTGAPGPLPPCVSTGPVVREDGTVAPCCSGLGYAAAGESPFAYGSAFEAGLGEVWERWRDDQLLRLMRLVGLRPLLAWLDPELLASVPDSADVCEVCVGVWALGDDVAAALRRHAERPETRAKLDAVERELYGEVWRSALPGRS